MITNNTELSSTRWIILIENKYELFFTQDKMIIKIVGRRPRPKPSTNLIALKMPVAILCSHFNHMLSTDPSRVSFIIISPSHLLTKDRRDRILRNNWKKAPIAKKTPNFWSIYRSISILSWYSQNRSSINGTVICNKQINRGYAPVIFIPIVHTIRLMY